MLYVFKGNLKENKSFAILNRDPGETPKALRTEKDGTENAEG